MTAQYPVPEKGGHTFRPDDAACLKCHEGPNPSVAKWRRMPRLYEGICLQCHDSSRLLTMRWRIEASLLLKQLKILLDGSPDKSSKAYKDARLNYNLVIADREIGLHNPRYAKALLEYSILSLRNASGN